MPLKLNVGLSKKIGQPDYGSLGASCNVEVELDSNLLQTDLEAFRERASRAFSACRQAVTDELTRHAGGEPTGSSNARSPTNGNGARSNANARANGNGSTNGNGHSQAKTNGSSRRASDKQIDYISQLAGQIRGLGVRRLDQLCQKMYSKPLADLSGMDASGLIDTLRAIKAGEIDVNQALNGAAS